MKRDVSDIDFLKECVKRAWQEHPEYTVAEAMKAASAETKVPLCDSDYYAWRHKDPDWKKLTDEHVQTRKEKMLHSVQDVYSRIPAIRLRLAKHSLNQLIPLSKLKWAGMILNPPKPKSKKEAKSFTSEEITEAKEILRKYAEEPWEFEMEGTQIGSSSLLLSKFDPAAKNVTEITGKDGGELKLTFVAKSDRPDAG